MAAEQCIPLTEKKVVVMPTKTVPQGISALLNFDPQAGLEQLKDAMNTAIESVHTAMVTYAARDSDFDGNSIHAGEYLALMDGKMLGNYTSLDTLFSELSWAFNEFNPSVITVYYGEDIREDEAEAVGEKLGEIFPETDITVMNGGQPVYYYMISVE